MIPKSLIQKVKALEIRTRKIVNSTFSGNYQSTFKGKGINFSDLRSYQSGDDIRTINWKVTARTGSPYINIYEEERELSVILMVDISGSGGFGSEKKTKVETAAEIAAILGFSAIKNNDKVGLILFTDTVELFIPPKKGKDHVLRIIRDIFYFKPKSKKTAINMALNHVMNSIKKKSIIFLVSDFIDHHFEQPLNIVSKKHDLVPIIIEDPREMSLPNVGILALEDQETGQMIHINTASSTLRNAYSNLKYAQRCDKERLFKSLSCDWIRLNTSEDYTLPLIHFFKRRLKK